MCLMCYLDNVGENRNKRKLSDEFIPMLDRP